MNEENKALILFLKERVVGYRARGLVRAVAALERVLPVIEAANWPISSGEEALLLPGVGKFVKDEIELGLREIAALQLLAAANSSPSSATASPLPPSPSLPPPPSFSSSTSTSTSPFASQVKQERATSVLDLTLEEDEEEEAAPTMHNERAPSPPASTPPPRSSSFTPSPSITPPSPSSQPTPSTQIQPQLISQVSVEQWLQLTIGLPQYLPNFIKSGYDRIDAICCIESETDLERIGIILPGHQKLLLRHIRALSSSEPPSAGTPLSPGFTPAIVTPPQPSPTRLITSSPSALPSVSSYAAISPLPPVSSSMESTAFASPPRRNGDPKSPRRGSPPSSVTTWKTVKPKTEFHSCPPTLGRTTSSTSVAETADPHSPSIAATGATNQRASTSAARTLIFTDEETSEFQPRTIRGCLETPTFVGDLGSLTASAFGTAAASPSFGGLAIGTGDSPNPVMLPQYLHLHCDVDSLNRGLAYYIVGAIQHKWEGPDKTTVTVYGTGKQIYTVQLAWRDQLLKSSHCTCPAFAKSGSGLRHAIRGWCKHIVCGFLSCVYGPKKAPRALAAQYGHLVLSNVTPALLRRAGWKPEDLANLPSPPTSASTIPSSPSGSPLPSYLTPSSGINGALGAPVLPGPPFPSSTSSSSLASSASSPPPPTRKQNRSPRPYIPRYRSGPYAIMLAMYQALILKKGHQLQLSEPDSMAKNEIIDLARPFTDSPWEREKGHCHDSRKWYTAWTSMDTVLVLKGLVIKSPDQRYSLSPSGIALAEQLWQEGCSLDPSLHPPASSPTSASTAPSPSLSPQSYSSSSTALVSTSLSSTLTSSSNISLNSPKSRTNSPSTSTSSSLLSRSTESVSTEIISKKPDVLQRAYSLPTGLTPTSSSQYETSSPSRQPSQPEEREITSGTINNETTAPIKAEEGEIDTDQLALQKALELSQQEALKLKQEEDEEEASLREALRLSLETSQASEFEWSVPQEENVEATQPFSLLPISTSKLQQQSATTTPMQLEEQETNMQQTNKEILSTMATEPETTLGQQSDEVIEDNTNQETNLTVMNDDTTVSQAEYKTEETSSIEEEERLPENHQELEQHKQQPSQQTTEAVQQTVVDRQQQDYLPTAQTENLNQSHEVEEEEKAGNDEEEPAEPSPTPYSTNVLPTNNNNNNNIPYSRVFNRVISGEEINKDFEVVLLVDTREPTEVRLPVLQCMHRAGLACEERALAAGDFLWIMREKDSYYEMERKRQWDRGQESQKPFSVTTSHSLLSESETSSSLWNDETQSQELPATTNRRRGRLRKRRSGGTEEWKEVKKEELVLDWIIERKSVTDLASSMESGRFSEQQERLLRSKMNVVTLVEGINANHCLLTEELFESVCDCLRFHRPNLFFVHTNTTDDTVWYLKTMTEEITHFYRRRGIFCSSPPPSSSLSNTFQLESGFSQPPSQLLQSNGETEDEAEAEEEARNNRNSEDSNKNNEDTGRSNYNGRKRKSNCNNNRGGEKRKKSTSSPAVIPLYELEEELPTRWMLFDEFNSRLKKGSDSISYTWKQQLMQIHRCSESKAKAIVRQYPTPFFLVAAYNAVEMEYLRDEEERLQQQQEEGEEKQKEIEDTTKEEEQSMEKGNGTQEKKKRGRKKKLQNLSLEQRKALLLADLPVVAEDAAINGVVRRKRIGPKLSTAIYQYFAC